MNWRAFAVFLALLMALILVLGLVSVIQRPNEIAFFFTGDTQGYLIPCGCKIVPAGGLARRASALDLLRRLRGGRVVSVELTHGFADRGPGREILNREMGRFFAREKTLVGLGSYDLLLGRETFAQAAPGVPLLLAGQPGMPGSVEFRLGGWGVGPLGEQGARLRMIFLAETAPGGVKLTDPLPVLRAEIAAHPAEGYIVAGQLSPATIAAILKETPNVVAVVAQWQTQVTTVPQRVGSTSIFLIGDRGRRYVALGVKRRPSEWETFPQIAYLGPDSPSDPAVQREALATLDEVARVNKEALAKLGKPPAAGRSYLGHDSCKGCHSRAHDAWAPSRHAKATADLAIDHQEQNPDCLLCHATAAGQPGGFPQQAPDLSGVQCEGCHGPGEGHPPGRMKALPASPAGCGACHGPRDSPTFNPEGYWKLVEHG